MARRRKILLHIGLPKTGTTAFQKICKGNPEALLLQRTRFYNSIWRGGTAAEELTLSVMRPGLECFASSKLGNAALADIRQRTRDGIGHLLQDPKADRFLLSDENLCFLRSEDELQRLRSLFPQDVDFEIYLMLRERRDWARSYSAQITNIAGRKPSTNPVSAFHVAPGSWIYDFEEIERVWRAAFGNVCILHYDPQRAVPDLFAAMGITLPPEAMAVRARPTDWRMRLKARWPALVHLGPALRRARQAVARVKRALF